MLHSSFYIFFFLVISCQESKASMFSWMWGKDMDDTTVLVADGIPLISIPYESMTEDEKFLQEAAKFSEIQVSSPLETCQHKVIMKIRTSCSEMTEEELAKLSVNLLNCQAAVEGRKMFPCTEEMSLKQCTTDMDADMWNAYHLMSNRARAVCYAARSTQFRALAELTVNKLMQTAHTQIKTLHSLKAGQDRLEEQTVEALSSLSEGNKALLQQQKHLKDVQALAYNLVRTNLRELNNEKALIRTGHTELAEMASDIRKKLEEANRNLKEQAIERGQNHREILQDLTNIQEQAELIWKRIEMSTNRIFAQHEEALHQYEETVQKLGQINDTIQYIWNVTNTMRAEVDDKLNWLTGYISDSGEQIHRIYRVGLHIIYLLFAMVFAAFLHAPLLTRVIILGIVPLNLVSYLKHGMEACLDFTSMTALIFLITMMHFFMVGIQRIFGPKSKVMHKESVQVTKKNGLSNGGTLNYDAIHANFQKAEMSTLTSYTKLKKAASKLYTFVRHNIIQWIQKCNTLIQTSVSRNKENSSHSEELSCSYISSRKHREDLVHNYEEFPSMSEDLTDFEHSRVMNERCENIDDLDNLTDANELRLRLRRREDLLARSVNSRQPSPSRSVTSTYGGVRVLCNAITKKGRKCQFMATNGQNFCGRHSFGGSILSDSPVYQ